MILKRIKEILLISAYTLGISYCTNYDETDFICEKRYNSTATYQYCDEVDSLETAESLLSENEYTGCVSEDDLVCCCRGREIDDEQRGIEIIIDELRNNDYLAEENENRISLRNPESGSYVTLSPDIWFKRDQSDPYSYLEFNSYQDSGMGLSSTYPFYEEINPAVETELRENLRKLLE